MKWLDALKIYNKDHNGAWCIPKRDTPEYKAVVDIMNGKHMRRQEVVEENTYVVRKPGPEEDTR